MVARHHKGRLQRHFAEISQRTEFVKFVDVALVPSVHGEQFEASEVLPGVGTTPLHLIAVFGRRVKEKVEVISAAKDVFLNGEFFFNVHVSAEITVISSDEVASTAFRTCVFHNDRSVDVVRIFDHFGHRASTIFEPLSLEGSTALPVQDVSVAKRGDLEVPEVVRPEVFNQRSVGDDDDVFFSEPLGVVKHFPIIIEHQPLIGVGSGKGLVESSTVFSDSNTEGAETLLACAMEDLKR